MNDTVVLIGSLALDTLHVVFIGLILIGIALGVLFHNSRQSLNHTSQALEEEKERSADLSERVAQLEQNVAITAATMESERATTQQMISRYESQIESLESSKRTLQLRAEDAERKVEGFKARQSEREAALEREKEQIDGMREAIEARFRDVAQTALRQSQSSFLETANETFGKHHESQSGQMKALITPIQEAIGKFETRVETLEKVRAEDKSAIFEQVKQIGAMLSENRTVTAKLVTALSTPKGGGRWGEESLRNVMEMAGLSEHADFTEQVQGTGDRMRPDVVIRMPGGREIVIDAKVSVDDFLRAAEEPDEKRRDGFLETHARKLREHVKRLASKEYWKHFEARVDFVAMYVPGENFYAAALQADRSLFDFAARNKVLIVTPSTLIALAKAVAYGWRQEEATKNAREAAELGRELYRRLATMGEHVAAVGKSLKSAVGNYDKMTASLDSRVMTQARRFEELQVAEPSGKSIPELPLIGGHSTTGSEPLVEEDNEPQETLAQH